MADEEKKVSPETTPKEEEQPKKEESAPKKFLGKYEKPEEMESAYKELETKLGQQSEEVRQAREFAAVVQPLLDEIRTDPELFKQLDEKLRKKDQPAQSAPQATNQTPDQGEMRNVAQDLILARFEEKHGIDRMSPDERKASRQAIGDMVYELTGQPFTTVDLRRLGNTLENAYILANKDTLMEKSKLEALAQARGVEEGSLSSMPSSPGKSEETLTSEESTVAEKMGLTREQYLEGKKLLANRKGK
jgi:hypothetical protein